LVLEGGTHNPWAPTHDFLAQVFFPLLGRLGINVSTSLQRYGFYPAGGGRFTVELRPREPLAAFDLLQRGPILERSATAIVAKLPRHIADRELTFIRTKLGWPAEWCQAREVSDSTSPGNVVFVTVRSRHITEQFTAFGRRGVRSERVAGELLHQVQTYLSSDVPVGTFLADQLMLPLSIVAWKSGRESRFRTGPLSTHALTQIDIIERFLPVRIHVETEPGARLVRII
jgi:RNA 3'-terminal phosphate cyclase (ATP)